MQHLVSLLSSMDSLAVAFSGGIDSSLLSVLAKKYVKGKVILINASTSFFTEQERLCVIKRGNENRHNIKIVKVDLLKVPEIRSNKFDRCYHCKKLLMGEILKVAASHGVNTIVDGSNMDDLFDYRPGYKAIKELGIVSPFIEAKITKNQIRKLAREYNLGNWDAPAQACLATRIPVDTPILEQDLRKIEQAERYLHSIGFLACRVRKLGGMAKIELPQNQITNFSLFYASVVRAFKEVGFQQITLDLEGYKQGSMNLRDGRRSSAL